MLSRTAERMYWFGRYLERAENTSRLVDVYANLMLDLPAAGEQQWAALIDITGSGEAFYAMYRNANERNVVKHLLADAGNPGSLIATLKMLRENIRTTRETLPSETWIRVNEFYYLVRNHVDKSLRGSARQSLLDEVIKACHVLTGLLLGTVSHGDAYNFIRIGRNLERADMTSRIVDIGSVTLLGDRPGEEEGAAADSILWANVLRSLSAYQMYRQFANDRVNGEDVVGFLIKDPKFPRAIARCLGVLSDCLNELPRNEAALRANSRLQRMIDEMDIAQLIGGDLHGAIDSLQLDLGELHGLVAQTWFDYAPQAASQVQSQA